jgi:hypothetical protein
LRPRRGGEARNPLASALPLPNDHPHAYWLVYISAGWIGFLFHLQMANTAYNGTDLIPLVNPKFRAEIRKEQAVLGIFISIIIRFYIFFLT